MEILRFHAHAFGAVLGLFGQIWTLIDKTGNLSPANGEMLARAVGELNRQCETLHLRSSQHLIGHFLDDLPGIHAFTEISARIKAMHRMVIDELEERLFLYVPPEKRAYFEEIPFDEEVLRAFPSSVAVEGTEAGKCFALSRYTACVFHLMRIMEIGLQKFGSKLGVTLVHEKNWQKILNDISKPIKALDDRKDPLVKIYAEIASHLFHVKVAWRNEVMHPKETYTEEEAQNIFLNVKTFISDLAQLL